MSINSIFQFLVPKDKKFFPLFEEASANLVQLASILHEAVNLPLKERNELFFKNRRIGTERGRHQRVKPILN